MQITEITQSTPLMPIIEHAPTRRLEVLPTVVPGVGHVTMVSIYPGVLFRRIRHNGMTDYRISAAPRGSYSALVVYDTQEWLNRVDPSDGKPNWIPAPIPASVVADSLLTIWARNTLGNKSGFAPGVGVIRGDTPTNEELKSLRTMQDNLFNWYILDANGKHLKGEATEINEVHRMAALEMLSHGAEKLPWYPKMIFTEVKVCLACGKQIETRALVCSECKTNLIDWYIKYGLDVNTDPAVRDFVAKMNTKTGQRIEKKGQES